MPLDGTAWANLQGRFNTYLEGKVPLELVPFGGGDAVPFVFQAGRPVNLRALEPGGMDEQTLVVMVRTPLETASQWTWSGHRWTAKAFNGDFQAGATMPHRVELVRHAS